MTNGFDLLVRRTNVVLASASLGTLNSATYSYDSASRLYSVSDANTNSATYQYIANSPLIGQVTFNQAATTRMTTVRQFDSLNRLTRISSSGPAMPVLSFDYMYNPANQRTRTLMADGSHWNYFYDSLGQVISGRKYFGDFSPTPGEQFDYNFDNIGNRLQTKAGGDQNGANQLAASYFPNSLNQYVQRTIPCAMDIIGVGFATNAVFVNGQAAWRKGEFFWSQLSVNNSTAPVWTNITVTATNQASVSGNEFLPQTPEQFTYDLDGNLTSDRRWNYVWDAENRLIALTNNTVVGPQQTLLFTYDVRGRRIRKQVIGDSASDVRFVYDGWNPLGELTSSNTVFQAYLWGADLSGSLQGAGGVGGLVAINDSAQAGHFAAFDGNGNVIALAKAADGTSSANYEYGPFGEVLRSTGPMAKANPFRFSAKYQDDETDLVYYGYRYYSAGAGMWISRDPIGEKGGKNLYALLRNSAIGKIDVLGKGDFEWQEPKEYDGGKPGGPGSTWWDPFSPQALVYSLNGCCFHVRLDGGQARAWILYNQGQLFGENILQHERDHVRLHFRPAYSDYKSAAAALGAPCMGKGRAMCLKRVIESELSAEYQARTFRDGAAYDWRDYGANNSDPAVQQQARDNMEITEREYQQAKKATSAAIAACPSE